MHIPSIGPIRCTCVEFNQRSFPPYFRHSFYNNAKVPYLPKICPKFYKCVAQSWAYSSNSVNIHFCPIIITHLWQTCCQNIFVNYIKKLSVLLKGGRLFFSMNSSFGKYVCDQAIEKILKPGLLPILLLGLFVEKDEVLFLANGGL